LHIRLRGKFIGLFQGLGRYINTINLKTRRSKKNRVSSAARSNIKRAAFWQKINVINKKLRWFILVVY
jgi:hypothetical protein